MKMKKIIKIFVLFIIVVLGILWYLNITQRTFIGRNAAQKYLENVQKSEIHNFIPEEGLVPDKETAVKISEAILSKIYGKRHIFFQQPFEVHLIDNFWVVKGTLYKGIWGGTAVIVINKKNGEIINVSHGK